MAQADIHQITWTATQAGYSFLDFGRRIGTAEYAADDAFLAIHAFTGAVRLCWTSRRCRALARHGRSCERLAAGACVTAARPAKPRWLWLVG